MENSIEGKKVLLIKYGEIALRKGNRALYERQLMNTIRRRLGGDQSIHVLREQGRLLVEDVSGDIDHQAVLSKIKNIFGITAFCVCVKMEKNDILDIKKAALSFYTENVAPIKQTFKVETKRGDKRYPLTSHQISAEVGAFLLEHVPGLTVDVHNPQSTLWIEIRSHVYIYLHAVPGESGLPYGASGKGVLLLSGGIDSPVAGYLMARRGVEILPVYFHSPPHTSERALDKSLDLARRLTQYTGGITCRVVPFTETQLYLYERVKPEKLTIFLKRSMLQIASLMAKVENAHCLITGDSVGQVASQTIHGLESVDSASAYPVLRPLAAMDKQQIITVAQAIQTYDISIRPYEDCCTVFVAEHPECRPKASVIAAIESRLDELPALWEKAVENVQIYEL